MSGFNGFVREAWIDVDSVNRRLSGFVEESGDWHSIGVVVTAVSGGEYEKDCVKIEFDGHSDGMFNSLSVAIDDTGRVVVSLVDGRTREVIDRMIVGNAPLELPF